MKMKDSSSLENDLCVLTYCLSLTYGCGCINFWANIDVVVLVFIFDVLGTYLQ